MRDSLAATVAALRRLAGSREGATAIEYSLIAGLISIAVIAGASAVGSTLDQYFQDIVGYF